MTTWQTETLGAMGMDRDLMNQLLDDLKITMAENQLGKEELKKYQHKPLIAKKAKSSDEVAAWANGTLTGLWAHVGQVYFIQDEADVMMFTLKWT